MEPVEWGGWELWNEMGYTSFPLPCTRRHQLEFMDGTFVLVGE